VPFLRQNLNLGLQQKNALEAYYNAAVTNWLNATADLQIIAPALKKALTPNGTLTNVGTSVVVGVRLRTRL